MAQIKLSKSSQFTEASGICVIVLWNILLGIEINFFVRSTIKDRKIIKFPMKSSVKVLLFDTFL